MNHMKTMSTSITETSLLPVHFVGLVHLIQPFYSSLSVPVSISSAKNFSAKVSYLVQFGRMFNVPLCNQAV